MHLDRRAFIRASGLGLLASSAACAFPGWAGSASPPPNFVVILTDDQGYGDLGCYGATGFSTPNLDRMAREGIQFSNFHVSQAVCSASRASLLTGCYANRVGIRGALGPNSKIGLNHEEETLAEVLKKRGYATGIFGKWHLGDHKKFLPLEHGFDEYLGLPYSNDMWPVDYDGSPFRKDVEDPHWKSRHPQLPLIDGSEKVAEIRTLADQDTLTTRYTERAVSFIQRNKARPFFLYLPHSMPHVPLGVSSKFRNKSRQGVYGDVIMEIDWSVGQVLHALEENGLEQNTLVIFTSDNGPWLNYGNHAGSTGGLREGKGTSWEGGKRVPCLMRWPGVIAPGITCDKLAATLDLLPSLAALAGAPLPEKPIDGVDITPLMKGKSAANPRKHFFYYYPQGGSRDQLQAVTDGRWKLHFPHAYRSYEGVSPGNNGWPGRYAKGKTDLALFDLQNDVGETTDLKALYPDVVQRLEALAEIAREDLGDQGIQGKGTRPPGRI